MANEIQSYGAGALGLTGAKKVIIDKLSYVSTVDAKIFDVAEQKEIGQEVFYWNYVTRKTPSATAARVEGATLTADTPDAEAQFTQYTEINSETYRVTSTMQARSKRNGQVGTPDRLGRSKSEAMEDLKSKCEWSLMRGAGAAGDFSSTSRKMKGLVTIAASGVSITGSASDFITTVGEAVYQAHVIAIRAAGGLRSKKKLTYMSYTNKQGVANTWKGCADSRQSDVSGMQIYADVDVYRSVHGPIQLAGHDLITDTYVCTLDPNKLIVRVLDPTSSGVNAVGKLFTEMAVSNEISLEYGPVPELGLITLS